MQQARLLKSPSSPSRKQLPSTPLSGSYSYSQRMYDQKEDPSLSSPSFSPRQNGYSTSMTPQREWEEKTQKHKQAHYSYHQQHRQSSPSTSSQASSSSYYRTPSSVHSDISYKRSLLKQSESNPDILVGWRINVPGYGVGMILGTYKSLGRSTKYRVQFESSDGGTRSSSSNGSYRSGFGMDDHVQLLSLRRGEKKGEIDFQLLTYKN